MESSLSATHRNEFPDDYDTLGAARTLAQRYAVAVTQELPGAEVVETDDVIRIAWGIMEGIVVLVTREALELRLQTIEWPHPHEPRRTSRLFRRIEWESIKSRKALRDLLKEAIEARRAEFGTCRYCGQSFPPERMIQGNVCHSCAEKHLDVIF